MTKCFGIDPGLAIVGWSVLEGDSSETPTIIDCGTIETHKKTPTPARLLELEQDLAALLDEFQPDLVAMEMPFFGIKIKAAGDVLQAVGVINLTCYRQTQLIPILLHQSSWKAHLGNGRATKSEVAEILQQLFDLKKLPIDDTVDAIAIAYAALCGLRNDIK